MKKLFLISLFLFSVNTFADFISSDFYSQVDSTLKNSNLCPEADEKEEAHLNEFILMHNKSKKESEPKRARGNKITIFVNSYTASEVEYINDKTNRKCAILKFGGCFMSNCYN